LLYVACNAPQKNSDTQLLKGSILNPDWIISADELTSWAQIRNENLPAYTGSPNWCNYLAFLEEKLHEYGVVDVFKNRWSFERWYTSDDATSWSLISDGDPVRVSHYDAYSGSTGPKGITAPLIYYDHDNPPHSIKDKIVVFPTLPHPCAPFDKEYLMYSTFNDYEYRSDDPFAPLFSYVDPAESVTFDTMYQLEQQFHELAIEDGAAGLVKICDMSYERTVGLYTFPVPTLHDMPGLILDREAGGKVIADAKAGKTAKLRLEATIETSEAMQLIAYLPGKDYGTPKDEQVLLVNHTDGPSISQDNGALGLLAIIKYFSNLPHEKRDRTLTVFLDCRHYMPGMEEAHQDVSWLDRYPEERDKIVSMIHIEHLGEMDYREVDGSVEAVCLPEQSLLWVRNNQRLIDEAIQAAKDQNVRRIQVVAPERRGINGGIQQWWWGVGVICLAEHHLDTGQPLLDIPGYGTTGFLGSYWTSASGIERWNCDHALRQVKMMTQLTSFLMQADLTEIKPQKAS
jgi:hypothetical protein